MTITSQSDLVAAIGTGYLASFYKAGQTAAGFISFFRAAGAPAAAAIPGTASGQTLSRTSAGALPIPAPSGTTYLTSFEAASNTPGTYFLADRLVETGTLSGITTTAQTVNSVALPSRATGATDVELWLEILTAVGATASPTVTASYTNQSGTAGRTATLVGGIPATGNTINRSYQMSLQAGDTGVQSVQSFTSTTSTGTAGAMGMVLRRTLVCGAVFGAGDSFELGYAETGLQIIPDDACLELIMTPGGSSSGPVMGTVGIVQG